VALLPLRQRTIGSSACCVRSIECGRFRPVQFQLIRVGKVYFAVTLAWLTPLPSAVGGAAGTGRPLLAYWLAISFLAACATLYFQVPDVVSVPSVELL